MRSKITTYWCSGCYPHGLVENDSHVLPLERHGVLCHVVHTPVVFKAVLFFGKHTFVFVAEFLCGRLGLPMETILDPC